MIITKFSEKDIFLFTMEIFPDGVILQTWAVIIHATCDGDKKGFRAGILKP